MICKMQRGGLKIWNREAQTADLIYTQENPAQGLFLFMRFEK